MIHRIASSIAESIGDLAKQEGNLQEESESNQIGRIGELDINLKDNKKILNSNYTENMARIIKLGTGGDDQDHVSTPKSIREKDSENNNGKTINYNPYSSYNHQMPRATSATSNFYNQRHNQTMGAKPNKRPFSNYNNQQ